MKKIIFVIAILLAGVSAARAQGDYKVDPGRSKIVGSVRYTLIGKYVATFEKFEGKITYDPDHLEKSAVSFKIKTASVKSHFPALDRIVRSRRLLDAAAYPDVTFQSRKIEKKGDRFWVQGDVTLHGVKKLLSFPFMIQSTDQRLIEAKGIWALNRKDFNVVWSPVLDRGGVIVSDAVNLDWRIVAVRKNPP